MKITLTYTALRTFLNCRKKFFFRNIMGIVRSGYEIPALQFGSAVHEGLSIWHDLGNPASVYDVNVEGELSPYYTAAMNGYTAWYGREALDAVEEIFEASIINPRTGHESRTFVLRGRIDGRKGPVLWEHKTTSKASGSYLERLWTDRQIMLYTYYLRQLGHDIREVTYNVIQKPQIRQGKKETVQEFEARLVEKYADGELFHRESLYFSDDDLDRVQWEIWELTQQVLDCRRRGVWLQNPSQCFSWNRACQYYPICKSNDNPIIIENQYEQKPPHEELKNDSPNS